MHARVATDSHAQSQISFPLEKSHWKLGFLTSRKLILDFASLQFSPARAEFVLLNHRKYSKYLSLKAMAKNRNKKKKISSAPMEISVDTYSIPQAMDTSETRAPYSAPGILDRKIKKGSLTRRSKSVRKKKAVEKATSQLEKLEVKILKNESKVLRTKSAKKLYE